MANIFPSRGDFDISSDIISEYFWIADEFIDGVFGNNARLVFPPKFSSCDNCKKDISTGRSSGIYNGTGPISFTNHTLCPRCNGRGTLELPSTQDIRLRVYWDSRSWIDIGMPIGSPDSTAMCIGYLSDLPALERANHIILHTDLQDIRRYIVQREGSAVPHGLSQNRYFIQYVKQIGN